MKMGTVSGYVLRDILKQHYAVVSKEEAKLHASAMEYINKMSNPGDWGIIYTTYFEKCNNVSALIGFTAGATMVGVGVGIYKAIKHCHAK